MQRTNRRRECRRRPDPTESAFEIVTAAVTSYPGGPSIKGLTAPTEHPSESLHGIEDMEGLRDAIPRRHRRARHRRHVVVSLIVWLALALSLGAYVGFDGSQHPVAAADAIGADQDTEISKEARRLLNELWKMEDLERARRP